MQHYEKAPIREAIIGLQFDALPATALASIERFTKDISAVYSERQDQFKYNVAYATHRETVSSSGTAGLNGYICRSTKLPQVVQARLDALLFSRLAPYESWAPFRDEARRLWELFQGLTGVPDAKIIGVRYINLLSLPEPVKFEDYFDIYPEAKARDIPIQNMLMRLEIPVPEINGTAILQEALAPPVQPNTTSVVLDIDVRVARDKTIDLWEQINRIRPIKNRLFEDSLTPLAKEAF